MASHTLTQLQLRRLLEFYFSDAHLPSLAAHVAKHPSPVPSTTTDKSWVPLSALLTYSRVKKLALGNVNAVVSAIRASSVLETDPDCTAVRRRDLRPVLALDSVVDFSAVHVSDLPLGIAANELRAHFEQFGAIKDFHVTNKRGTAAVVRFVEEQSAERAVASARHVYDGEPFRVAYKTRSVDVPKPKPTSAAAASVAPTSSRKRARNDEPTVLADVVAPSSASTATAVSTDATMKLGYTPGCVVAVTGAAAAVATKVALRPFFEPYGAIKVITLTDLAAYIEYTTPLAADVVSAISASAVRDKFGANASLTALMGDAELTYHGDRARTLKAKSKGKGKRAGGKRVGTATGKSAASKGLVVEFDQDEDEDLDELARPKKRRTLTKAEEERLDALMAGFETVAV
ncbi:hypothetical protein AMAG_16787 [Allomyces macrogynus ATCC 38327]|uniref:HTH La-type RNA-binding domain-containing protein n=1 Tax=Allomyces macrogynus (strain ATCC 38327) TaxID=578462 RepID=A0A0L0TCN3_ALLM3|nr:hypothetical protein AMAG_16787 [Allomyces macrogynus ATCC 38327]|eukprot:KNE72299.1 hypothetical protein AMAG_16787 [Allomyces macrogynus ATCC 38327]